VYTFTITPSNVSGNGPTTSAQTATLSTLSVTTLAGLAGPGGAGSADGTGSAARFAFPDGITYDTSGNIYVADTFNNIIRKIVASTGVVTTLAGLAGSTGSTDGTGSAARFNGPEGITCDTSGNIYVADRSNHTIRKIVASTGVVTTFAGTAGSPGSTDGTGSAARFSSPWGIVCDTSGNIYVADAGNSIIRKIVASSAAVTTLAGTAGSYGSANGTGSAAQFNGPEGITCDTSGNIYVADTFNHTIRKIVASTGVVTTFAGTAGYSGPTDGTGTSAQFYRPSGVSCDASGNIWVADTFNHTIRKIFASSAVVTTIAGLVGSGPFNSADGTGSAARFWGPRALVCDPAGTVYVADSQNNTVRKIA
jgi:sugar lactone lactonase YvrE